MSANAARKDGITPKQEKAIQALLAHPTIEDAAKAAGVTRQTIFRWLQQEDFQSAYTKARRETVRHAIALLQSSSSEAVGVLTSIMTDQTANVFARASAAKTVIEQSMKAVEIEDLAKRLSELEDVVKLQAEQIELNKQAEKKQ